MKIAENCLVEIEYVLVDEDGEVLEESGEAGDGPARYVQGLGLILPGLEAALEGAEAGASLEVRLQPEDAYGAYDPAGLVNVPRTELPPDAELVPGDWITVTVADDEDAEGREDELEMRVVELNEGGVILDANHPLAGKEVTFRVKVLSVCAATAEDVERARAELE